MKRMIEGLHLYCYDDLSVDFATVQRNTRLLDVAETVLCAVNRCNCFIAHESEDFIDDILCREITEKARQVNPVGDILDGVEAIEGEYTAQYAGVAHDASLFHGGERVLQEAWADEIEGFGDAVDLAGEPAIVQHSFVRF